MIRVPTASEATQEFLGDVSEMAHNAAELGGARAKQALTEIRDDIQHRRVNRLSRIDPAGVVLTYDQWEQLARKAGVLASSSADQW